MLRNRNTNASKNSQQKGAAKPGDLPVKRGAARSLENDEKRSLSGEPKAKKAALSELRTQISSALHINSLRKKKEEDPAPHYDYDAENKSDPFNVPDFAFDIFKYHRFREEAFTCPAYMEKQQLLTRDTRAILVDWMIELQETFELNHETLYLSVKMVDLYISRIDGMVKRDELQLIACAAIFIASKYDERSPPLIDDFLYMAEDAFTRSDMEQMERTMLRTLSFDLGAPLSYSFLRRYAKAGKVDMPTLTLARYILETSLMFYEFVTASESKLASGAFLLALRMKDSDAEWSAVLHKYSGVSAAEAEEWCWEMNHMLHVRTSERGVHAKCKTAFQKYSHSVFFESASVPLLPDVYDSERLIEVPN